MHEGAHWCQGNDGIKIVASCFVQELVEEAIPDDDLAEQKAMKERQLQSVHELKAEIQELISRRRSPHAASTSA